jgi:hypothetical protein
MSSTTNVAIEKNIETYKDKILGGTVLVIDPASNSVGYAIYVKGKLSLKGTITAKAKTPIWERLFEITSRLPQMNIDLLAIELVRQPMGHVYLVWSVGAIVAAYGKPTIEIPQRMWKEAVDENYVKTDETDAVYIGKFLMRRATGDKVVRKL